MELSHTQITHALLHIRPGAQWNLRGTKIEWLDRSQTEPSADEIAAACHKCSPEKEAFQRMSADEKIAYMAKRLGLED